MATFKDRTGREWVLDLDVHLVEQVHKRTEVRIDHLLADQFAGLEKLFGSVVAFGLVLWVLVQEQADKKALTPEDFARALDGDALEGAGNAFMAALADFSPRHQRALLKALAARGKELAAETLPEKLAAIAEYRPPSSTPAGAAAAFSDSTPAPAG